MVLKSYRDLIRSRQTTAFVSQWDLYQCAHSLYSYVSLDSPFSTRTRVNHLIHHISQSVKFLKNNYGKSDKTNTLDFDLFFVFIFSRSNTYPTSVTSVGDLQSTIFYINFFEKFNKMILY